MSLYYEAASILSDAAGEGSLKSRIYNDSSQLKSRPAQLYALITETAKYDVFLKEVIDNAGFLSLEPKMTPLLSLLIVHDHLFSKNGIAASKEHVLTQTILRHKARIQAEFTKATRRRKCASTQQLVELLAGEHSYEAHSQPRWVRVNRLKTDIDGALAASFLEYLSQPDLRKIMNTDQRQKWYCLDKDVPNLVAFPPGTDMSRRIGYKRGDFILQDKASCFPAYMLLGESDDEEVGDIMDACAAPGNKTTHLASILWSRRKHQTKAMQQRIFACERDPRRSETLQQMVNTAGADKLVTVLRKQDFLALDPNDGRFVNVTHLLLDPSCSGSGIVGREDIPKLALPENPRIKNQKTQQSSGTTAEELKSKKRKRGGDTTSPKKVDEPDLEEIPRGVDKYRLEKLSNLQTRIIEHALSFPAARRVTYSTCSIHSEENERVIARVLGVITKESGWRLLEREEQAKGMREWEHRGEFGLEEDVQLAGVQSPIHPSLTEQSCQACIRCHPGSEAGTMGFFVCCFVREGGTTWNKRTGQKPDNPRAGRQDRHSSSSPEEDEDAWDGFGD